ncbi:fumarylacetoacetate hydrolase family protein [Shinella daejeonensis]|uniref:fumarylacetoacetate hydrolase family protein n=1 Tax=Shinella daejeonensis TaxID=659017 RepID=UPI0020C7ECFC|nr:fumarylacetoacetate hydrolase family protein [Shinella daejeonensis]MCP8895196.1 fumarylacetoacetate hydrolase family protein [Shinella daejeonensis]
MKLATLKDSTRDGQLVVVSRDLTRCSEVGHIARTLQDALDDWAHVGPRLARVAEGLEAGAQPTTRFHEQEAASPLPRAYQRLGYYPSREGCAGKVGDAIPLRQEASGGFLGPRADICFPKDVAEADIVAGIAVIVDDVPAGASLTEAGDAIRLVMLAGDMSAREPLPSHGNGDGHPLRLCSAFSPVAVTPDELSGIWRDWRLDAPLHVSLNGRHVETPASKATPGFAEIVAHAARFQALDAGSILVVSRGVSARSAPGDRMRIEMKDEAGHSIFGAIEQAVETPGAS